MDVNKSAEKTNGNVAPRQTSILHRTPEIPPVAVSGQGPYITLEDGKVVLDAVGGAAVTCIGNGHPDVIKAVQKQVEKLSYVYNMQLSNDVSESLASELVASGKGAFELCGFVAGGSEAMEGCIKLARQYFYETGQPQRKHFIARLLSFHGNTLGTLSVGHNLERRIPYEAILNHDVFHYVSPAYYKRFKHEKETETDYVRRLAEELEAKFQELGPQNVIGFVAETVVGATTAVVPAPKGYFKAMKEVAHKHGALCILDEVMCGMGRMGTLHAWESFGDGEAPDIQAVAKGLGGGYAAIGAVLMSRQVANGIRDRNGFWKHGHTYQVRLVHIVPFVLAVAYEYQAHPLSCAASLAVQKVIRQENLLENNLKQGAYLVSLLREKLESPNALARPYIFDIRGGGLWYGIEFEIPKEKMGIHKFGVVVQAKCFNKGLIIIGFAAERNLQGTEGDYCMLSPAYNITKREVDSIVNIFVESIEETIKEFNF